MLVVAEDVSDESESEGEKRLTGRSCERDSKFQSKWGA